MNTNNKQLRSAIFIKRINRFISIVKLDNKEIQVYVPNTGRLSELAIRGNNVLLIHSSGKYPYKILYIYHNKFPVMIDSLYSNKLFSDLLMDGSIKELNEYRFIKREPAFHKHRFDFLMKDRDGMEFFIELKSCTLRWNHIASFPDAISTRASSHVNLLAETDNGILVFFILHNRIKYFIPNYHTDFEFYKAIKLNQNRVRLLAYSVNYDDDFNITELNIVPVKIPDVKPVGAYLIIFHNREKKQIKTGKLGLIKYVEGYYVYVGSGRNNVFKRIAHHKKSGRKKHWHIDYIKGHMKIISDIPIVRDDDIECQLSQWLNGIEGRPVFNFGSSDCRCKGHLIYFKDNPMDRHDFWDFIFRKRWDKYNYP